MKNLCSNCRKRPATYHRPNGGQLASRRDHDLCRQCFKAECERQRAARNAKEAVERELSLAWNHAAKALNCGALGIISGVRLAVVLIDALLNRAHAFFTPELPEQKLADIITDRPYEEF